MLDNLLRLPGAVRVVVAAAAVAAPLAYAWRRIVRPRIWRMSPERVARALEASEGVADNALINACQFEGAHVGGASEALVRLVVAEGVRQTGGVRPAALFQPRRLRRLAVTFAVCAALAGVYVAYWPHYAGNAWRRLSRPWADIPPASEWIVTLEPSGRVTVFEGDDIPVRVAVRQASGGRAGGAGAPELRLSAGGREGAAERTRSLSFSGTRAGARLYSGVIEAVRDPLLARCWSGGACSPALRVKVRPLPLLGETVFAITPPAYTGLAEEQVAGPPAPLEIIRGSRVSLQVAADQKTDGLIWRCGSGADPLRRDGRSLRWRADLEAAKLVASGPYEVLAVLEGRERTVARGVLSVRPDNPPEAAVAAAEQQRLCWPGETVAFAISGRDDLGLRELSVAVAGVQDGAACATKRWAYGRAPGQREASEAYRLDVRGDVFQPGSAYALTVRAVDFAGQTGVSERVLLRVRRPAEALAGEDDAAKRAVDALQRAIDEQRRALGLTRNLELHLEEAVRAAHLERHGSGITTAQTAAQRHGREAVAQTEADAAQASALQRLKTLVELEMGLVLDAVPKIASGAAQTRGGRVTAVAERQAYILNELIMLQGRVAAAARLRRESAAQGEKPAPTATAEDVARDLTDLLNDFLHVQRRIVEQTRQLAERKPEDLSEEELEILGQLAREEAKWAAFLKDKLNDLAKNPLQDFADGSLAEEFNEVWQDVQKAAEALYAKKIELAVPLEQSGLENAEELVNNLERWLPDKPDNLKWLMEEPAATPDAPLAELPGELEDIVGELLDKEEEMTEDVEDVTSGWIDSIDKGAGWDAMDGPISSMSAKGVTGNLLPNQQEVGGRSGEGRTGRSTGQMVESAAEGKDGRQTPSRLSETPFESGRVDDKSQQDSGGATGGGKLSGFGEQGLRGPTSVPRLDAMKRLAGKQAEIRQQAEQVALHLRARGLPAGDLGASIAHMRDLEDAAQKGDGAVVRQAFDAAVGRARDARTSVGAAERVRREAAGLTRREADELWAGLRDDIPAGYEAVVGAYYRRVTEKGR